MTPIRNDRTFDRSKDRDVRIRRQESIYVAPSCCRSAHCIIAKWETVWLVDLKQLRLAGVAACFAASSALHFQPNKMGSRSVSQCVCVLAPALARIVQPAGCGELNDHVGPPPDTVLVGMMVPADRPFLSVWYKMAIETAPTDLYD